MGWYFDLALRCLVLEILKIIFKHILDSSITILLKHCTTIKYYKLEALYITYCVLDCKKLSFSMHSTSDFWSNHTDYSLGGGLKIRYLLTI